MHMSPSLTVLEFVCNLRWVLLYATQRLDPVIESHYASVMGFAQMAETALSRSFAAVRSVREIPAAAIQVVRNGAIYLLVAEAVLGHCPPTMHSFLLRATSGSVDGGESSVESSAFQADPSMSEPQTHFVLVRWLIAEGLLTDEELLDSLDDFQVPRSAAGRFELHIAMAKELATSEPFALGAHVIITRALLLHYCSSVVSAEDIVAHVRFLNPLCAGELHGMEDTLLFWVRNVIERQQQCNGVAGTQLDYAARATLRGSLYRALQSGVVPALLVYYYQPRLLSVADITTGDKGYANWAAVLRAAEELGLSLGLYADEVSEAGALVLQLHVLRLAEELFAVLATQAEDAKETAATERSTSPTLPPLPPPTQSVRSTPLAHKCPKNKDDDENDDTSLKVGSGVPSMQEYPSAHSLRLYDLMTASIHMRNAGAVEVPVSAPSSVKSRDPPPSALVDSNTAYSTPRCLFDSERSNDAKPLIPAVLVTSHRSLSLPAKPSEQIKFSEEQETIEAPRMESLGGTCTTSESSFVIQTVHREDGMSLPLPQLLLPDFIPGEGMRGSGNALVEESTEVSPLTPMETSAYDAPGPLPLPYGRESFGDRDALPRALQREQVPFQPFGQRNSANKRAGDGWGISELSDWGSVRTSHRFFCSDVDQRTDDSAQHADTDVSSVLDNLDDLLDGAESFFVT